MLEDEAIRRARDGVTIPVFYAGKEVGAIRRPSDTLLMFLLRAHRPERYRERPWVAAGGPYRAVSGGFGAPPPGNGRQPWEMSEDELDREIEALLPGAGPPALPPPGETAE